MWLKKYLAEAIGTFAIVFFGTGSIIVNQEMNGVVTHVGIAMTFGLVVMAMVYALGSISGAHLNPAVSIAFLITREFPGRQVLPYIASQCAGALMASMALRLLFPMNEYLGTTIPSGTGLQSLVLECILTFFLALVILGVAKGGTYAGLAIGSTVLLEALFAGPISGASMNPARSLAPALVSGHMEHIWIYLLAPVTGAMLAVAFWNLIKPTSHDTTN